MYKIISYIIFVFCRVQIGWIGQIINIKK